MKSEQIRIAITPELKKKFKEQCENDSQKMSTVLENYIKNYSKYKQMKNIISNLKKEKIKTNDGEIEVIRLKNDLVANIKDDDSGTVQYLMNV